MSLTSRSKTSVVLFWVLAVLLIPVIAYVYGLLMMAFLWIVTIPFENFANRYATLFSYLLIFASTILAVGTVLVVWNRFKVQYLKETPLVNEQSMGDFLNN